MGRSHSCRRDREIETAMKWQNLIKKTCPKCGALLEGRQDRVKLYECTDTACDFVITERKLFEILTDETHVLRQHLGPEELDIINKAVASLTQ